MSASQKLPTVHAAFVCVDIHLRLHHIHMSLRSLILHLSPTPPISSTRLLALTLRYHLYILRTYPDDFYHTILLPPRICILQPCIPIFTTVSLFCFPKASYLPHLYRLLLQIICSQLGCLSNSISLQHYCLSFCSYSYRSKDSLLRH